MKKFLTLLTTIVATATLFAQTSPAYNSLAIGTNATASGQNSLAVGYNSKAGGVNSGAIGQSIATADGSVGLGQGSTASGPYSIALNGGTSSGERSFSTNGGFASALYSIALGGFASGPSSVTLGTIRTNGKKGAVAIGDVNDNGSFGNNADNQMMMRFAGGFKLYTSSTLQALSIDPNGTVGIDQSNQNRGNLAGGLIFGIQSGEGIASNRSGGGTNPWGLDFYGGGINRMVITNGGRVGIGTTSPQQHLSIGTGMNIDQNNSNNGSLNSGLTFGSGSGEGIASNRSGDMNRNSYGLDFYAGGINRMCIRNDGRVGIGITVPQHSLHVVGNILASGTVQAVGIPTPSDIRYKKNILPITSALKTVMALSGYTYLLRKEEFPEWSFDSKPQYGLIAQEVETVLPELVYTGADGYKAIEYSRIIPFLIESIKEQQKQIDELKKLVVTLIKNK